MVIVVEAIVIVVVAIVVVVVVVVIVVVRVLVTVLVTVLSLVPGVVIVESLTSGGQKHRQLQSLARNNLQEKSEFAKQN